MHREPSAALRDQLIGDAEQVRFSRAFGTLELSKWSLLSAQILPPFGANTEFVDTRMVYDAVQARAAGAAGRARYSHCAARATLRA